MLFEGEMWEFVADEVFVEFAEGEAFFGERAEFGDAGLAAE